MKHGIHPEYGPVVFRDVSVPEGTEGREFLTRSTLAPTATATTVRTGRVERFNRRYGRGEKA
jgi:large subunit ribosomal protein L31